MNNEQNKKVEDILSSLDGVQKAVAPDFFYTRLKARMEKQDKARREMYLQAVEAEERQVARAREILGGE